MAASDVAGVLRTSALLLNLSAQPPASGTTPSSPAATASAPGGNRGQGHTSRPRSQHVGAKVRCKGVRAKAQRAGAEAQGAGAKAQGVGAEAQRGRSKLPAQPVRRCGCSACLRRCTSLWLPEAAPTSHICPQPASCRSPLTLMYTSIPLSFCLIKLMLVSCSQQYILSFDACLMP